MDRHRLSETFVESLSLGLAASLEKLPGVQDVRMAKVGTLCGVLELGNQSWWINLLNILGPLFISAMTCTDYLLLILNPLTCHPVICYRKPGLT